MSQTTLERTMFRASSHSEPRNVIPTAGMVDGSTGMRMYGLFLDDSDVRSPNADQLCIATVSEDDLTQEQRAMAERNTEAISDPQPS